MQDPSCLAGTDRVISLQPALAGKSLSVPSPSPKLTARSAAVFFLQNSRQGEYFVRSIRSLAFPTLAALAALSVWGQSYQGGLRGTVTDPAAAHGRTGAGNHHPRKHQRAPRRPRSSPPRTPSASSLLASSGLSGEAWWWPRSSSLLSHPRALTPERTNGTITLTARNNGVSSPVPEPDLRWLVSLLLRNFRGSTRKCKRPWRPGVQANIILTR